MSKYSQADKKVMFFPMRSALEESTNGLKNLREHYGIKSGEWNHIVDDSKMISDTPKDTEEKDANGKDIRSN